MIASVQPISKDFLEDPPGRVLGQPWDSCESRTGCDYTIRIRFLGTCSNWDRVVRPDSGRKTFLDSPDSHKFLLAPVRFLLRARRSWDHAWRFLNRCARILEGYKSNWRINVDFWTDFDVSFDTRESFGFWWLYVKLTKDMDKKIF